jgi:hypothetical protein
MDTGCTFTSAVGVAVGDAAVVNVVGAAVVVASATAVAAVGAAVVVAPAGVVPVIGAAVVVALAAVVAVLGATVVAAPAAVAPVVGAAVVVAPAAVVAVVGVAVAVASATVEVLTGVTVTVRVTAVLLESPSLITKLTTRSAASCVPVGSSDVLEYVTARSAVSQVATDALPTIVSTPVPSAYTPMMPPVAVKASSSPVVKPELIVTVALGRVKLSVSDTVIASVTARARPFSVYASAAVSRPDSTGFCCAAATATSIAIIVCHIVIRIVPAREVGSSRCLDR